MIDSGLLLNVRLCTLDAPLAVVEHAALAWQNGRIAYAGAASALPSDYQHLPQFDGAARLLTPAFVDCHTHLVFAGNRACEFAMRLDGLSYTEIAKAGGGIMSSVRHTQNATVEQLVAAALPRALALAREGVASIEIKSGYGLTLAAERAMLQAATELGRRTGLQISRTFLGLHALPMEARTSEQARSHWIAEVCEQWLPQLAAEGLVDAVDGFCENIAFTTSEIAQLFDAAKKLGVPVKLHAEQLSDSAGSQLVARYGGLSADHLEYLSDEGVVALKASGSVAVLLPAAFYCLRETKVPPVSALRAAGVPMAVASDCNPGTSPQLSLRLAMHQACTLFGLSIGEALQGATRHAARALGLQDRGQLLAGMRADFVLWPAQHPAELVYWIGDFPAELWVGGKRFSPAS